MNEIFIYSRYVKIIHSKAMVFEEAKCTLLSHSLLTEHNDRARAETNLKCDQLQSIEFTLILKLLMSQCKNIIQ